MKSKHLKLLAGLFLLAAVLFTAAYAEHPNAEHPKQNDKQPPSAKPAEKAEAETEREVTESQVPPAALATLKKMAAGAEITEFAEEVEHGSTFYEGSWETLTGVKTDVLVTPTGDLVEIEEKIPSDQVPAAVLAAARKEAGKDAKLTFEKKTMILYEAKFEKDQLRYELVLSPAGRQIKKETKKAEGPKEE